VGDWGHDHIGRPRAAGESGRGRPDGPHRASDHEELTLSFLPRHLGPDAAETAIMLETVGAADLDELVARAVPATIASSEPLGLPAPMSEH
jgi:hypothetical protein